LDGMEDKIDCAQTRDDGRFHSEMTTIPFFAIGSGLDYYDKRTRS